MTDRLWQDAHHDGHRGERRRRPLVAAYRGSAGEVATRLKNEIFRGDTPPPLPVPVHPTSPTPPHPQLAGKKCVDLLGQSKGGELRLLNDGPMSVKPVGASEHTISSPEQVLQVRLKISVGTERLESIRCCKLSPPSQLRAVTCFLILA